ncbi:HDR090Wp [Eremothecium sinecaudum]|uniref:HDR090Wp n=1 Tax=Eremothecium sinecaudum TaxID=45286 RepID=A0A0X8HSV3_9SACH|nr:HDR090Wp [Eremothecium sinecaudum]AMD20832.1 HDR090Wp [Eremothecium sinecaudum]
MSEDKNHKNETPWELSYSKGGSELNGEDLEKYLEHGSGVNRRLSNDRFISSHLSQWNYNHNRGALVQGIEEATGLINDLICENDQRPIHVPESDLEILKIDVKLNGNWRDNLSLDKEAMASVFKSQASSSLDHLAKLLVRVQDKSSKVFVTGDLNAGKSTLCNALLRKHVLPEDQLPCTNVFCEILEARENNDIEQVHAVPTDVAATVKEAYEVYNIGDQTTYQVFSVDDLKSIVYKSSEYSLLKIYIKDDQRPADASLLRNGTADTALIDSPGLNMDSVQTTEVMSRQEEIDLVIFVVNAENQLTLSAKEFITMASKEKKFMFFVVNKFDQIKDKQRCKKLILDQIKEISVETYKKAEEFIHFVSSEEVINSLGGGGGPDNGPDDNGNDGENPGNPDFEGLEESLRNFVLKKRSISKLMPAKTYLLKLLSDVESISSWNLKSYKVEEESIKAELEELSPIIQGTKMHCVKITDAVDKESERVVNYIYDYTKQRVLSSLALSPSDFPAYDGLSNIHDYIFRARQFIIEQIKKSVVDSERQAKLATEQAVVDINAMAKNELGDDFMSDRVFQSDLMFTRKKHSLAKQLNVSFNLKDLFAPTFDGFINYITCGFAIQGKTEDKTIEQQNPMMGSLGLTNYSFSKYWTNPSLIFTSKIPALAVYSYGGVKVLTNGLLYGSRFFTWQSIKRLSTSVLLIGSVLGVAYLISDLPRALPMNLSRNYGKKLHELDYIHSNADRISKEVREVLKIPTREIVKTCELLLDRKQAQRAKLESKIEDNRASVVFFDGLAQRASKHHRILEEINLDVD